MFIRGSKIESSALILTCVTQELGSSLMGGCDDMQGGRSPHPRGSDFGTSAGGVDDDDICGDIWVEVGEIMMGVCPPLLLCGDVVWDMGEGVGGDMLPPPPPKLSTKSCDSGAIMKGSCTGGWLL